MQACGATVSESASEILRMPNEALREYGMKHFANAGSGLSPRASAKPVQGLSIHLPSSFQILTKS